MIIGRTEMRSLDPFPPHALIDEPRVDWNSPKFTEAEFPEDYEGGLLERSSALMLVDLSL